LRPHVPDSLDHQGRHAARGNLLELHPFFTGKQKLIDTAGRVERFTKKYADAAAKSAAAKK